MKEINYGEYIKNLKTKRLSDLTTNEIDDLIRFYYDEGMRANGTLVNIQSLLSEKSSRSQKSSVRASLFLSVLAFVVAFTSLTFSFLDFRGDIKWQSQQLDYLRIISNQNTTNADTKNIVEPDTILKSN